MVNIWPHDSNHSWQTCSFGQVTDDFPTLDSGIVIFINKHRFDDNKNLVNERSYQVIKLVENSVNNLDKQMSLLRVLIGHEQRQNMIEQRPCAKLSGVDCDLPQC